MDTGKKVFVNIPRSAAGCGGGCVRPGFGRGRDPSCFAARTSVICHVSRHSCRTGRHTRRVQNIVIIGNTRALAAAATHALAEPAGARALALLMYRASSYNSPIKYRDRHGRARRSVFPNNTTRLESARCARNPRGIVRPAAPHINRTLDEGKIAAKTERRERTRDGWGAPVLHGPRAPRARTRPRTTSPQSGPPKGCNWLPGLPAVLIHASHNHHNPYRKMQYTPLVCFQIAVGSGKSLQPTIPHRKLTTTNPSPLRESWPAMVIESCSWNHWNLT